MKTYKTQAEFDADVKDGLFKVDDDVTFEFDLVTHADIDAYNKFGCLRLSARIHDLKHEGHKIARKLIKVSKHTEVAQYRLEA